MFSFDLNIFQVDTEYISSQHWIYQFNTEWKTSQKEYISSQQYFKSTPKIVETEAQSIPLRISTKPHVIIYIFIRTFTFVRWLIKAMREKNIILFPQYNILIPQLINMFPQERHFFPHNILFCSHNILSCSLNISFCSHNISYCSLNILFCSHNILSCSINILFCSRSKMATSGEPSLTSDLMGNTFKNLLRRNYWINWSKTWSQ